jgi:ADP-ribose pyrophosphatase
VRENQQIRKEDIKAVFDSPYVKVADIQYAPGKHYYDATRRNMEELIAVKSDEEFRTMLPDAVSCIVILDTPGEEPKLLLSYEYRYPVGRYLLSVPAGLLDKEDEDGQDPVYSAAVREIKEETGLEVTEGDRVFAVNPLVFSTPGMTDESNALVCAVLRNADLSALSQEGAVGSEQFDGFALLTREDAIRVLRDGRDERGNFYPLYTWAALSYFVSDAWKI